MKKRQIQLLKRAHIYHLTASVGQKSRHRLPESPAQGLKAAVQVSAGSHLRLGVIFEAYVVGGGIHVFAALESSWWLAPQGQ